MNRIALITEIDHETLEKRRKVLRENGIEVDHYSNPIHFRDTYQNNPAPDQIVSAVNFKSTGLREWRNISHLLGTKQKSKELKSAPILTFSVYIYPETIGLYGKPLTEEMETLKLVCAETIPADCLEAINCGIIKHVYMNQWIGGFLNGKNNPDCFRDSVLPHIIGALPHQAGAPLREAGITDNRP